MERVVIIGSGCAGLTAAIYAARANLKPVVVSGVEAGGQLMITTEVENYPGFPDGILGPDLIEKMKAQAVRFGSEFRDGNIKKVAFKPAEHRVYLGDGSEIATRAVIVASGASAQWLGLESETRLRGKGVSSCATCDGAFFRGKRVAVVGGGDSACEEANFLTRFASQVVMIHRRDQLRASKIMQDRVKKNPKMDFRWNAVVVEVIGQDKVQALKVKNVKTGQVTEETFDGLFVAIGHKPNTSIFKGQIALDDQGYIVVHDRTLTSVEGVFSAGDVHDRRYRQAVTAAGSGCMAAMDCEKYLESLEA